MSTHRIGTISLDFAVARKAQAWPLQQAFEKLIVDQLLPAIEEAFDRIDESDQLISLDRLDISLGTLSPDQLQEAFVPGVLQQILAGIQPAQSPDQGGELTTLSRPIALWKALVHFLASGELPPALQDGFETATETEWQEMLALFPIEREEVVQLLRDQPEARIRLRHQFPPAFVQQLTGGVDDMPPAGTTDLNPRSQGNDTTLLPSQDAAIPVPRGEESLETKGTEEVGRDEASKGFSTDSVDPASFGQEPLSEQSHSPLGEGVDVGPIESSDPASFGQEPLSEQVYIPPEQEVDGPSGAEPLPTHHDLSNAGLVLLHPYLSGDNVADFALLEEVGLTQDHEFLGERAQARAVHLLHYLVWGQKEQLEVKMRLEKLLCGIPFSQSINRFLPLTDAEKAACERVAALISADWRGVSAMELAVLQETFLQRSGKLGPHYLGHQLQVERKTEDILLERLPHGLPPIKLPWMTQFLWIEW